jgi:hypothetical protein
LQNHPDFSMGRLPRPKTHAAFFLLWRPEGRSRIDSRDLSTPLEFIKWQLRFGDWQL